MMAMVIHTTFLMVVSLLLAIPQGMIMAQITPSYVYASCSNSAGNYTAGSQFETNLNIVLIRQLYNNGGDSIFSNVTEGEEPDKVYGLFLCRGDVAAPDCQKCIDVASGNIKKECPLRKEAIIWYDECLIRYSNISMFGKMEEFPNIGLVNPENVTEPDKFNQIVVTMFKELSVVATENPSNRMYATKNTSVSGPLPTLYGMVQCTPDLSGLDCRTCLEAAISFLFDFAAGKQGGRTLSPSCNVRYELYPFSGDPRVDAEPPSANGTDIGGGEPPAANGTDIGIGGGVPPSANGTDIGGGAPPSPTGTDIGGGSVDITGGGSESKGKKIAIGVSVSVFVVVALLGSGIYYRRRRQTIEEEERENSQEVQLLELAQGTFVDDYSTENFQGEANTKSKEFASIQLDIILIATKHFSDENKLGEGGFGPVYKGTLPDGKEIAVKRLSKTSGQGLLELENEVTMIARLQHRNLVRLLGCCLEGNEALLIYEYMPNKSLDVFLFDSTKGAELDWKRRLLIINGTARGLLYLHEDSRLRIIHRDLKASNILLDHEMNPKISDFGMARIFGGNQSEANTIRVVGTYGYMAPEYAMEGLFSVKSDVFSFGVLLLEIISGKKNSGFHHSKHGHSLLTFAWKLWSEGRGLELLDLSLVQSCVAVEVSKCIHIGLLCVQEDPADRPTMSFVVVMLASDTMTLPQPTEPAFSVGRHALIPTQSSSDVNILSANELTVSDLSPR